MNIRSGSINFDLLKNFNQQKNLSAQSDSPPQTNTERLFQHLHRDGIVSHLWTDAGHQSYWFNIERCAHCPRRIIPRHWHKNNVFFAVNPLAQIPPQNTSGNKDPRYISSQLDYITAVNALFAEYDGKDYVRLPEFVAELPADFNRLSDIGQRKAVRAAKEEAFYRTPDRFKQRTLQMIHGLDIEPSIIVDSGGGYHCYWLLRNPVPVDEVNRGDVQAIQHGWVQMVRGDPGASDLRRVLRMPGTYNMKPGFGLQHPKVDFVKADFDQLYDYHALQELVSDWLHENRPRNVSAAMQRSARANDDHSIRAIFNRHYSLVDLLTGHGYQISFESENLVRLARPGRNRHQSSVTVFPAREDGAPELSVHFSTNDELYSDEYIDETTGQIRRRAHDAFTVYRILQHDGDWRAAYESAEEALNAEGLLVETEDEGSLFSNS